MTFNTKKFMQEKFTPRTEDVPVPEMSEWFDGDPVWTVRGLEGVELGLANVAAAKNKNIGAIVEMLQSAKVGPKIDGVSKVMDLATGHTPEDIAKRYEHLMLASLDPVCDLELALKVCKVYPIEFLIITKKILELTGKGMMPGKPKSFGKKPTSPKA